VRRAAILKSNLMKHELAYWRRRDLVNDVNPSNCTKLKAAPIGAGRF